jgi:hypothetical protein
MIRGPTLCALGERKLKCHEHDEGSQRALWEELTDDIVREHLKYSPGTRPWGWRKWEAPELRRVVGRECINPDHDDDCDGDHDHGRLPADQDPNLPEWAKGKYYFAPLRCTTDSCMNRRPII